MEPKGETWIVKLGAGYIGDRKRVSSVPYGYEKGHSWGPRVFPFVQLLEEAGRYPKDMAENLAGFLGGMVKECPLADLLEHQKRMLLMETDTCKKCGVKRRDKADDAGLCICHFWTYMRTYGVPQCDECYKKGGYDFLERTFYPVKCRRYEECPQ